MESTVCCFDPWCLIKLLSPIDGGFYFVSSSLAEMKSHKWRISLEACFLPCLIYLFKYGFVMLRRLDSLVFYILTL